MFSLVFSIGILKKKHSNTVLLCRATAASRDLCTVGGMVANNAGGEKSLQHGKTEKFVTKLKVVLSDGEEYEVKPLSLGELKTKMAKNDFEGKLYRQIYDLINKNYQEIKEAKPNVSKDSTAYHVWNVYDKDRGTFDLGQLIIGSQGTLGVITDIEFKLVAAPKDWELRYVSSKN